MFNLLDLAGKFFLCLRFYEFLFVCLLIQNLEKYQFNIFIEGILIFLCKFCVNLWVVFLVPEVLHLLELLLILVLGQEDLCQLGVEILRTTSVRISDCKAGDVIQVYVGVVFGELI